MKCPFDCMFKGYYGTCKIDKCIRGEYKNMWNGDELDHKKYEQYKKQAESPKEKE